MSSNRHSVHRQKKATKIITQSAKATYQSQLEADPGMEQRKILAQTLFNRHVLEARKAMGR